ncbi:YqhG family protein [Thermoflavimicrobium daqui]|jgi:hypothetical protein|uniref:Uncharacterized protein n=1 Tax=Thermoflavimicrobium daqui TaxID=2137476 RepID=A0A364K8H6_9BACL|nr:YqhG family protein [Thermoflavimicrobium daqui]RAL26599.1 hypothetical protein DL897_00675 [Thermoflavimicrobium daqui]
MDQQKVRSFTERYLQAYQCHLIESAPTHIKTQLSIKADKDLLNRPFYWMYVERMNLPPQPAQFCFIFDPEHRPAELRGEYLFFGSPRFSQMLNSAQKHGRFVRLYQQPLSKARNDFSSKPYTPWLGINFKVSYICDQKKDRICYLGMNLRTGNIVEPFYPKINSFDWTSKLPPKRHLIEPRFHFAESVDELEYYLKEQIEQEDPTWAYEANKRLELELKQLDHYYPELGKRTEEQEKERSQRRREIIWQYQPRVEVQVINAGIFYMEADPFLE